MKTEDYNKLIYRPGVLCTIQPGMKFISESHPFLGIECVIIKQTKSGLIQIALNSDRRKTISVAIHDIVLDREKYELT